MREKIAQSEYGDSPRNYHIQHVGNELEVTLTYPERGPSDRAQFVVVDQESVRASDGIRLHYDYDRDGWVICQPGRNAWLHGEEPDQDWQETAFVQSWARMEEVEETLARFTRETDAQSKDEQ